MTITVRAFADYREIMGPEGAFPLAEAKTIGDLLTERCNLYPALRREMFTPAGELKEFINIFLNGRNIAFLSEMTTTLTDGDIVALSPPVAGG